jgi:hypothetical protein
MRLEDLLAAEQKKTAELHGETGKRRAAEEAAQDARAELSQVRQTLSGAEQELERLRPTLAASVPRSELAAAKVLD